MAWERITKTSSVNARLFHIYCSYDICNCLRQTIVYVYSSVSNDRLKVVIQEILDRLSIKEYFNSLLIIIY